MVLTRVLVRRRAPHRACPSVALSAMSLLWEVSVWMQQALTYAILKGFLLLVWLRIRRVSLLASFSACTH